MSQVEEVIGHRNIPLAYFMQEDEIPPPAADLLIGKTYSEEHGLVNV